jgi:hypothetical protein
MAPLPALLTALDLIRAVGAVGLGRITGPGLDRAQGLGLDRVRGLALVRVRGLALVRILDRALVPAMVRVPITALVLDRRAARRALLRLLTIRLNRLSLRQRSLRYFPIFKVEKHFHERSAKLRIPRLRSPEFPVEPRGVDRPHAPFLKRKAHTRSCLLQRGRKSGSG